MRPFSLPWKSLLLAAGAASCAALNAQPYVTVPVGPNIVIVSPGAGSPGAGQIGNGGVVSMKDPDATGGTFSITGVTGTPKWELFGDISAPGNGIYLVNNTSCGIRTYNKSVRSSESNPPEAPSHARSKGMVRVSYQTAGCGGILTFDIYKRWGDPATTTAGDNYAPPIAGPDCWGTGLIPFSVDQVSSDNAVDPIGTDLYYWRVTKSLPIVTELPNAAFYYSSADRSSITIDQNSSAFTSWYTGSAGGTYTIQCCYGIANPWPGGTNTTRQVAGNTCVIKTISPSAPALTFTTPIPTCLALNATSFHAEYTRVAGHTYAWSASCLGWTVQSGVGGSNQGTLDVSNIGQSSCTLILTDEGPCGAKVTRYNVNRNFDATLVPTSTSTCIRPGYPFTVAVPPAAQSNCVNWTISPAPSPAWTFTDADATHSVRTYTAPQTLTEVGKAFIITASNCTCPGNSAGLTQNIQPLGYPVITCSTPGYPVTNSQQCVPFNTTAPILTYTATNVTGATSFVWNDYSYTGFMNNMGMTDNGSTTSTITYQPTGTASGQVRCYPVGTNGCGGLMQPMNVSRIPPAPVLTNPGCTRSSTLLQLSVQQMEGMCYSWTIPAGLGSPSSTTGSSISFTTNAGLTPGATFNCSVTANNCAVAGYPSCTPATTNFTITVCANMPLQGGGPAPTTVGAAKSMLNENGPAVEVSPNPNSGLFTVTIPDQVQAASATLYDASGKQVGTPQRLSVGPNTMGKQDLAPGIYTVHIQVDGKTIARQVAVQRD